jgi:hypothetical protein
MIMQKIHVISYVLFYLLFAQVVHAQNTASEQLTVPLSDPGKSYTLKVNLVTGSIKAASYAGKDILIEVNTPGQNKRDMTEDAGNGMKRISPRNSFDITATEDNNIVTVDNNNVNKPVILTLKIPQNVKLKLSTVNEGEIEVNNVQGELEINNVNGSIKLTNISGSVIATTVNGDLTASFYSIDPKAPMAFTTLNGNVDVTFPAAAKSNLKLKSDQGEIYTDFDIEIDKSEPKVNRTSQSGMYQLKLDDWIIGRINGGGAEILMKNMDGDIYFRKAK